MVAFLFWNIQRKPLQQALAELADEHNPDFFILAECQIPYATLISTINASARSFPYCRIDSKCSHIITLTRFPDHARTIYDDNGSRMTICKISLPLHLDFLLAATHFPSRVNWAPDSLASYSQRIASMLRYIESTQALDRTVLFGDLNMDPYAPGVLSADGFHAVMTKALARKGSRTVQGSTLPYFYNPLWSHYGDAVPPPGTHYHYRSESVVQFWHMYDQVLVRPSLIDRFVHEDVRILHTCAGQSMLTEDGIPDQDRWSDHLPLLVAIDLELH